jgi:hypothetical protein
MQSFTFDVVVSLNGGEPTGTITGPPSLTALVTTAEASIAISLVNRLPSDWMLTFDGDQPLLWTDFCGQAISQPSFITPSTAATSISLSDSNSPGASIESTLPIIVRFTPQIVATPPGGPPVAIQVPDPTIINVDPVGGTPET